MTNDAGTRNRILGSLRSADGVGVLRLEDRFDTPIDELWTTLTDTRQLGRWYGDIEGELGVGGAYRARLHSSGWEGTGRVEACEPPRRFVVVTKASHEPNEVSTEVTLAGEGDQTVLVVEKRGLPLDLLWAFGAGNQIHVEDLAALLSGRERVDAQTRFAQLEPAYRELAAKIS